SDSDKEDYDMDDFFDSVISGLSKDDKIYSLPFYSESSMLYYNKEILKDAGVEMPKHPTWHEVADAAKKIQEEEDMPGIVLRGQPGWGEQLAPLGTVINAFGGRWYDEDWNAQLTSDKTKEAVQFYVNLINDAGESGATDTGFSEALNLMAQGEAGMWYDSTVAAGSLADEDDSDVVDKIGYSYAPKEEKDHNGWLFAWSLGIEAASKHK